MNGSMSFGTAAPARCAGLPGCGGPSAASGGGSDSPCSTAGGGTARAICTNASYSPLPALDGRPYVAHAADITHPITCLQP